MRSVYSIIAHGLNGMCTAMRLPDNDAAAAISRPSFSRKCVGDYLKFVLMRNLWVSCKFFLINLDSV